MNIMQKEAIEYDQDMADDDLNRIIRLKEELTDWLDSVANIVKDSPKRFFAPNFDEWATYATATEEGFDDLLHSEWHRLTSISQSVEWTSEIPSCDTLRAKMAKDSRIAKEKRFAARAITNPSTHAAIGKPL